LKPSSFVVPAQAGESGGKQGWLLALKLTYMRENSMSRLRPEKLHVRFTPGVTAQDPITPRRYTLTHSDATGDLFLTIGPDYDRAQTSGWYTRLMRDEVLAEWQAEEAGLALHVYCHVSGGLVFGTAGLRYSIFRRELPLALEALRSGDRQFFEAYPELNRAPIHVHFRAAQRRYNHTESWGAPADYRPELAHTEPKS